MDNGCLRCKGRYTVNEVTEDGIPLHVHYCNECTKQCSKCEEWKTVDGFLPETSSQAYIDWVNTRSARFDEPLGLLMGRASRLDECIKCRPFRTTPVSVDEPPAKEEVIDVEVVEVPRVDYMAELDKVLAEFK